MIMIYAYHYFPEALFLLIPCFYILLTPQHLIMGYICYFDSYTGCYQWVVLWVGELTELYLYWNLLASLCELIEQVFGSWGLKLVFTSKYIYQLRISES